jgi:anti-anti-sigma factor
MSRFVIESEARDDAVVLRLAGELDLGTANQVEAALESALGRSPRVVVIDLRDLSFIDSTGLRVVLDAEASSRQNGYALRLVRGPAQVDRVFKLTGMDSHLTMGDELEGLLE